MVFKTREQFIQYANFIDIEKKFNIYIESNDFEEAYRIYTKAQKQMKVLQQSKEVGILMLKIELK